MTRRYSPNKSAAVECIPAHPAQSVKQLVPATRGQTRPAGTHPPGNPRDARARGRIFPAVGSSSLCPLPALIAGEGRWSAGIPRPLARPNSVATFTSRLRPPRPALRDLMIGAAAPPGGESDAPVTTRGTKGPASAPLYKLRAQSIGTSLPAAHKESRRKKAAREKVETAGALRKPIRTSARAKRRRAPKRARASGTGGARPRRRRVNSRLQPPERATLRPGAPERAR